MLPDTMDLFYESIIVEWKNNYGYENITEEDINEYFTNWFYQIDDDIEMDILNQAEEYIRKRCNL